MAKRTNLVTRVTHARPVVVLEDESANEREFAKADALKSSGELRRRDEDFYIRQDSIRAMREWEKGL